MYALRHKNILPLLGVIRDIPAILSGYSGITSGYLPPVIYFLSLSGYSEHGDLRQLLRKRIICEQTNPDDPGFISVR